MEVCRKMEESSRMPSLLLRLKEIGSIVFSIASKLLFLRLVPREFCYKKFRDLNKWDQWYL